MSMFPDNPDPAWDALATRLLRFADEAGAPNAIVFDSSDAVLCRGRTLDEQAHVQVGTVVVAANEQLARARSRRVHLFEPEAVVHVFAGIYRLAVWFDAPCDDLRVEAAAHAHLGAIEALTLALPPPFGPGAGAGKAAVRQSS